MTTLERILVPTDLSAVSNSIFPHALTLAQAFRSKTYLLHVMDPDSLNEPEKLGDFPRLSRFLGTDLNEPDLPPLTVRIPVGKVYRYSDSPVDAILEFARRKHVNLICLASTESERRLAWWSAGAVIEQVVAKSPCSVLCLRGRRLRDKDWKRPRFQHVLLLSELNAHGATSLQKILPLVQKFNSMLHVLPLFDDRSARSADALPPQAVSHLRGSRTNILLFAAPRRRLKNLLEFVAQTPMDLIAMSPRMRARYSTPLINDVLVRLMQATDSPILMLR